MNDKEINADDKELGERIRRYAEYGAIQAPQTRFSVNDDQVASPRRFWLSVPLAPVAVAAFALILVVGATTALRGIGQKPTATPIPTQSATETTPSSTPEATLEATLEATPAATPGPPVITGVLPDAGVRPPAGVRTLSGVSVYDVVSATAGLGLFCQSSAQDIELGSTFVVACAGDAQGASFRIRVNYWGLDYVGDIEIFVVSANGGVAIDPHTSSRPIFLKMAGLPLERTDSGALGQFVMGKIDDSACGASPCVLTLGSVDIRLQFGVDGGRTLQILPAA